MTMDADARWERWCTDFDGAHRDISTLFHNRHVRMTIEEMWKTSADVQLNTVVTNWLTRLYVTTQLAGVRRETDRNQDTSSLRRCLEELVKSPEIASRARYEAEIDKKSSLDDELKASVKAGFDLFAAPGEPHIDAGLIQQDIDKLHAAFAACSRYTNKILLHRQRNGQTLGLTLSWEELDTALNTVGTVLKRYYRLRHPGSVLAHLTPDLPSGWTEAFATPWLPDGFAGVPAHCVDDHTGPPRQDAPPQDDPADDQDDADPTAP